MSYEKIHVSLIVTGTNDRKKFNRDRLEDLGTSIDKHGLAQPPGFRLLANGKYEIVYGERRTRAMRDVLGWEYIPAQIIEADDEKASALMLLENTARVDLNPIEEANGYQQRIDKLGWDVAKICEVSGVRKGVVENRLALLKLAPDVQEYLKSGQFPERYALRLVDLDNNRQRIALQVYNKSKAMTLIKWREIVGKLTDEQVNESQMDFFSMVSGMIEEAENGPPSKGKNAVTGAPAFRDLPEVRFTKQDSVAPILDRYIRDLTAGGHTEAAGAICNVYNLLVHKGWVTVSGELALPYVCETGTVNEELHARKID